MKSYFLIILLIFFLRCNRKPSTVKTDNLNLPEEIYHDSLNIGVKGKYRYELKKYRKDSTYVVLHFFERRKGKWIQKQYFKFHKDGILDCDPSVEDLNNDGFNDFSYRSAAAARSANEIRKLFIFNHKTGTFIYIKNSEEYPNIKYNEKLKCLDAFSVYAGTTSSFLKINKDSLKEFAAVDLFDNTITVREINDSGVEKIICKDKAEDCCYIRYKNFQPLEKYPEYGTAANSQ